MTVGADNGGVKRAPVTRLCRGCGNAGHNIRTCPARDQTAPMPSKSELQKAGRAREVAGGLCCDCKARPLADDSLSRCEGCRDRLRDLKSIQATGSLDTIKCGGGCGAFVAKNRGRRYCAACWRKGIPQSRRSSAWLGAPLSKRPEDRIVLAHDEIGELP